MSMRPLSTLLGHMPDETDRPLRRDSGRCDRRGVCLCPAKSGRSSISSLAVSRFALSLHMWISAPGERATFPYKTIADPLAFWN